MALSKIGVLGSGMVGQVLAAGFVKHGYQVMMGTRSPAKLSGWLAGAGNGVRAGSFSEAAAFGEAVVLAVKGGAAESALELAGSKNLAGKIVIDTTNPIADEPPEDGVLRFFTDLDESLMERLQQKEPAARFVKAFSCVGNALMVDPKLAGGKPTMFIAGNDESAKKEVTSILTQFGWETEDMGGAAAARAIEPLCILWCIPGFRRNEWGHAFKLLRA
jgi:predicted dinucleotide-binding enzyme